MITFSLSIPWPVWTGIAFALVAILLFVVRPFGRDLAGPATPVGGPSGQPTATLAPSPAVVASGASPVATTAATATGVSVPTVPPTAIPTATLLVPTATAIIPPTPTASRPTPCPIQAVRGFGLLYSTNTALAARLGCARGAESGGAMTLQTFERGRLIGQSERREILALTADGRWRAFPDTFEGSEPTPTVPNEPQRGFGKVWREQSAIRTALGAPTAPERASGGAVQEFDNGRLLWTEERLIDAILPDGTWASYTDTFVEPTATPVARPTSATTAPPATAIPAATAPPATLAPARAGCGIEPVRGFGLVYRDNQGVATRLGCARANEVGVSAGRQPFERGLMIARPEARQILVIRNDGGWAAYPDTWQPGEPLGDGGTPPVGRFVPDRSFGKLWRQALEVRQAQGWATAVEQSVPAAVQEFNTGTMLWTSDRVIYVLYTGGTWQSFPDRFVD